jgi:hypothetical protein
LIVVEDRKEPMVARLICAGLLALLVWCVSAAASAAPETGAQEPRKLSKTDLRRFRAIMADAVKAARKGDHKTAMAAYDRALAIKPNDQGALTDQGWSAFQLQLFERAEAITRLALENYESDRRSAAAHYNLGRILEARGNRAGAIAAYQASLETRPTRTVREHLATLDPAAAAAADPLRPVPMLGPFARLADFCKTKEEYQRRDCPAPGRGAKVEDVGAPYKDVVWIEVGDEPWCFIAIRLAAGWFVSPKGWGCTGDAEARINLESFAMDDLVPGGAREIVARTSTTFMELYVVNDGPVKSYAKDCESRMLACGVPSKAGVQSGPPTCIEMPDGNGTSWCSGDWAWQLQPDFTADGFVDVKATGTPDDTARALMGRRRLAFP